MKVPGTPYHLEMRADSLTLNEDVSQLSTRSSKEFSLRNMYVRGTLCVMLQAKCTSRCPDSKEGQITLQRLNSCSSFISQDETMSECPVKTLQNAIGRQLISKRPLTFLCHVERHAKFTALNFDNAWYFLNIVRNPNITVSTRKWPSLSLLTSRSVRIFLTSLV